MLEGYVTFPGRYKHDIEPLFTTISTSKYDYPEFIQKRQRRNSSNYTVYGTITPSNVLDLMTMLAVLNKTLDGGIPYSVAFGIN